MKSFKEYLTESPEMVEIYLQRFDSSIYEDDIKHGSYDYKNKIINVSKSVDFNGWDRKELPVQFGRINGILRLINSDLTSFKNFPSECEAIHMNVNLDLRSLVGISKHVKKCQLINFTQCKFIKEGGIELLLIKGLEAIRADDAGEFSYAMPILNKYLPQGRDGLLECQEELIENGFERFAKL